MLAGNSGGHVAEFEPKKVGRPRAEQTLPLILAQNRPKVVREFTLDAQISQLIEDYTSWAAETGGISSDEARMLLIGRSVDAFIRKDVLFRHHLQDQKGTKQP
jgi:predicted YcjX-like family ATPase